MEFSGTSVVVLESTRAVGIRAQAELAALVKEHPDALVSFATGATYKAFYSYLCALEGADPPATGGPVFLPSFRARNEKLRNLGWKPHYPTYRCGIV